MTNQSREASRTEIFIYARVQMLFVINAGLFGVELWRVRLENGIKKKWYAIVFRWNLRKTRNAHVFWLCTSRHNISQTEIMKIDLLIWKRCNFENNSSFLITNFLCCDQVVSQLYRSVCRITPGPWPTAGRCYRRKCWRRRWQEVVWGEKCQVWCVSKAYQQEWKERCMKRWSDQQCCSV